MPWTLKRQLGSSLGAHARWLLDHYVVDGGPSSCVSDKFSGAVGRGDQFDSDSDSDDDEQPEVEHQTKEQPATEPAAMRGSYPEELAIARAAIRRVVLHDHPMEVSNGSPSDSEMDSSDIGHSDSEISTPNEFGVFQDADGHPTDDLDFAFRSDPVVAPATPPPNEQLSKAESKRPLPYEPFLNMVTGARFMKDDSDNDQRPDDRPAATSWPTGEIPVEIFELITSHLTRAEVKSLRLVCREFETKVSAQYFRNVVVPFRTELYGADERGIPRNHSSDPFSNGMRIFEQFGPHIIRFALSLELDEESLSYPPLKPTQQAVPSFWGFYRWPHESYNRYADLAGIEDTADQTANMKKALSHLSKVTNLGLCCDAGLGFLYGPDASARHAVPKQPVFTTQNWRQSKHQKTGTNSQVVTVADFNGVARPKSTYAGKEEGLDWKRETLRKMVMDAGVSEPHVDDAMKLLLGTEGTTLQQIEFDGADEKNAEFHSEFVHVAPEPIHNFFETGPSITARQEPGQAKQTRSSQEQKYPLIPVSLTRGQKEMLLELEWAHRAMIQSYVLSMIDNAHLGNLNSLTTLTIAKIPSSQVGILCRDDFWDSFPNLTTVSLGVIPDWRRIIRPEPDSLADVEVSPLEAVGKVNTLLQHIASCPDIESVHFEWICGGEFASSMYHRNQHVLPLPFVPDASDMADPDFCVHSVNSILNMPHIKHLSLKNCWAAPHVFMQAIRQMALSSLEKLDLESVSLSGPPTRHEQAPFPAIPLAGQSDHQINHILAHQQIMNLAAGNTMTPHSLSLVTAEEEAATIAKRPLQLPNWFSWSGFIEHFSPTTKIRDSVENGHKWTALEDPPRTKLDAVSQFINRPYKLASDENCYMLKSISFKSCGYVAIEDTLIDTRSLLPYRSSPIPGAINYNTGPVGRMMQRCTDKHMGRILPFLSDTDLTNLTKGFGLVTGWNRIYDDKMIVAAMEDGIDCPGLGRFTGALQVQPAAAMP